jgi:hypothetical protein
MLLRHDAKPLSVGAYIGRGAERALKRERKPVPGERVNGKGRVTDEFDAGTFGRVRDGGCCITQCGLRVCWSWPAKLCDG